MASTSSIIEVMNSVNLEDEEEGVLILGKEKINTTTNLNLGYTTCIALFTMCYTRDILK